MTMVNVKCLDGRILGIAADNDWSVRELRASAEQQLAGSYKLFYKVAVLLLSKIPTGIFESHITGHNILHAVMLCPHVDHSKAVKSETACIRKERESAVFFFVKCKTSKVACLHRAKNCRLAGQ